MNEVNIGFEDLYDDLLSGLSEYFPPDSEIKGIKLWVDTAIDRTSGPLTPKGLTISYEREKLSKGVKQG